MFKNSKHTNRIGGKACAEVIPNGVHGGLNGRFEETGDLCTVRVGV